jgi:ubiquinone/menaquinone biosynthesis C-methylase UbiE
MHHMHPQKKQSKKTTSWGSEAAWYSDHLAQGDTYHAKVLLPNILRLVEPKKGQQVLEIGCGEGFFARELARAGSTITASDIAPELIAVGKKKGGGVTYVVSKAQDLSWAPKKQFDVVLAVLTIQNMEQIDMVMKQVRSVLKDNGRFIFVLNHPVFRIPKESSWGFDEKENTQYRRIDAYLSVKKTAIDMHPGTKTDKSVTYTFHRSLQEYMKVLRSAGFCLTRLEEWISHKTSEAGPRAKAENTARKEFPLFMMIEAAPRE